MISARLVRMFSAALICVQFILCVALVAVLPGSRSEARESSPSIQWNPSDIMVSTPRNAGMTAHEAPLSNGLDATDDSRIADGEEMEAYDEGSCEGEAFEQDGQAEGWPEDPSSMPQADCPWYSSEQFQRDGVIDEGGVRYTWYSENVLPGGGLSIDGRHVSEDGYVVDAYGRIVVASSDLPYGSEVSVPFGDGRAIVLDSGCAPGVIDVYTSF